jgi:YfiH family protein
MNDPRDTALCPLEAANLAALPGIRHGFFTRKGGVSTGIYSGLNCGRGSKDDLTHTNENRRRAAAHLGVESPQLINIWQIHSAEAVVLDRALEPGEIIKADAIVTRRRGLAAGVLTADCAPVLFADAEAGVVAAAHAGWRGALGGVLEAAIDAMLGLGARRERIAAAVGPAISAAAYEVGEDFQRTFTEQNPAYAVYFHSFVDGGRPRFDLPRFASDRILAAGIPSVARLDACTYSNESMLYSYRRSVHANEPDYGRQISAILISNVDNS